MQRRDVVYLIAISILGVVCVVLLVKQGRPPDSSTTIAASFQQTNQTGQNEETSHTSPVRSETNDLSILNGYVAKTGFPIVFDRNLNEYELVYTHSNKDEDMVTQMPLKYDPWTGQRLPPSKRDQMFTTVSVEDRNQIDAKSKGANTLEDVKRIFGVPDSTTGPFENVKTQWTYTHNFKTAQVIVKELEDGTLEIGYSGKPN